MIKIHIPGLLYQVGNTSSRKITEVKQLQLGPRVVLGKVTIQGLAMDAVVTNTVKIPEAEKQGLYYMLLGQKDSYTVPTGGAILNLIVIIFLTVQTFHGLKVSTINFC